jgi:hypothetical protein
MPKLINDDELLAMASVVSTLTELGPAAQERVVAYLVARFKPHTYSNGVVPVREEVSDLWPNSGVPMIGDDT